MHTVARKFTCEHLFSSKLIRGQFALTRTSVRDVNLSHYPPPGTFVLHLELALILQ